MKVPVYVNMPLTDGEGNITTQWELLINQLLQELQANFSDEGLVMPSKPTDEINIIETAQDSDLNDIYPDGTMLYDDTTNEAKIKINGVFRVIQVV